MTDDVNITPKDETTYSIGLSGSGDDLKADVTHGGFTTNLRMEGSVRLLQELLMHARNATQKRGQVLEEELAGHDRVYLLTAFKTLEVERAHPSAEEVHEKVRVVGAALTEERAHELTMEAYDKLGVEWEVEEQVIPLFTADPEEFDMDGSTSLLPARFHPDQ